MALLLETFACATIGGVIGSLIVLARQGRVRRHIPTPHPPVIHYPGTSEED